MIIRHKIIENRKDYRGKLNKVLKDVETQIKIYNDEKNKILKEIDKYHALEDLVKNK